MLSKRLILFAITLFMILPNLAFSESYGCFDVTWTPLEISPLYQSWQVQIKNICEYNRYIHPIFVLDKTNFDDSIDVSILEPTIINETYDYGGTYIEAIYNGYRELPFETIQVENFYWFKVTESITINELETKTYVINFTTPYVGNSKIDVEGRIGVIIDDHYYHPWFYADWGFRRPIIITEHNNTNLTDYVMYFNITYDSDMNPDFSDIRFTWLNETSGEEEEIPYWIETYENASWVKVWTKVPFIPANGTALVYVYYGNPTATDASNFNAVFYKIPQLDWEAIFNPNADLEAAQDIVVDLDGNYVAVGYANYSTDTEWVIIKYAPNGTVLWQISSNPTSDTDAAYAIAIDNDGNYVIAGFQYSAVDDYAWRIEKRYPNGTLIWSKVIDYGLSDDRALDIAVDNDNNIIVAGYVNGTAWAVMKLDENGTVLWTDVLDSGNTVDVANYRYLDALTTTIEGDAATAIAVDPDNNYFVVGWYNGDWYVQKYDTNGAVLCNLFSNIDGMPYDVVLNNNGNFVVAGYSITGTDMEWRIRKYNPSCAVILDRIDDESIKDDYAYAISIDFEQNYVIGGVVQIGINFKWRIKKYTKYELADIWSFTRAPPFEGDLTSIAFDWNQYTYIAAGYDSETGSQQWRVEKYDIYNVIYLDYPPTYEIGTEETPNAPPEITILFPYQNEYTNIPEFHVVAYDDKNDTLLLELYVDNQLIYSNDSYTNGTVLVIQHNLSDGEDYVVYARAFDGEKWGYSDEIYFHFTHFHLRTLIKSSFIEFGDSQLITVSTTLENTTSTTVEMWTTTYETTTDLVNKTMNFDNFTEGWYHYTLNVPCEDVAIVYFNVYVTNITNTYKSGPFSYVCGGIPLATGSQTAWTPPGGAGAYSPQPGLGVKSFSTKITYGECVDDVLVVELKRTWYNEDVDISIVGLEGFVTYPSTYELVPGTNLIPIKICGAELGDYIGDVVIETNFGTYRSELVLHVEQPMAQIPTIAGLPLWLVIIMIVLGIWFLR